MRKKLLEFIKREFSPKRILARQKASLKRQMTLAVSSIIIGLLLLVAIPMIILSVQIQRFEEVKEQQEIANQMAEAVAAIIHNIETNQSQIALPNPNDPRINFIATEITNNLNLAASRVLNQIEQASQQSLNLDSLFETNPQILEIAQFDQNGDLVKNVWSSPKAALNAVGFRKSTSFALASQGVNVQEVLFVEQYNTPILVVASPLIKQDDVIGVIMAWVDVEAIWQTLADFKISETGYLYIINQGDGPVIIPPQFSPVTMPVSTRNAIQSNQAYQGLNGESVIGYIATVEGTPWRVVIEIPTWEANSRVRSLLIIITAILMFGLSLAISLARIFSQWVLHPIQILHQSALKISAGDLSHRIVLNRNDELGFLATAFNKMVSTLEKTINELRRVSLRLLSAEESERQRIAHEIHDELGQTLTALRFSISLVSRDIPDNPILQNCQKMAAEAQEKARTLSHELRPAMLDELGLLPTLNWYIDRFEQRANLALSLEANLDENHLPTEYKTAIYRLIVEALTNINKHASASAVEIILTETIKNDNQNDDLPIHELTLIIADDGDGFEVETLKHTQSLGISGMNERVSLLSGKFLLESNIGQGTKITITLPI